jgi:hypothetical protein
MKLVRDVLPKFMHEIIYKFFKTNHHYEVEVNEECDSEKLKSLKLFQNLDLEVSRCMPGLRKFHTVCINFFNANSDGPSYILLPLLL